MFDTNFFEPVLDTYFFLIFLTWTIFLKSLLDLLEHCSALCFDFFIIFCCCLFVFNHKAWRILAAWLGIEPTGPALEN